MLTGVCCATVGTTGSAAGSTPTGSNSAPQTQAQKVAAQNVGSSTNIVVGEPLKMIFSQSSRRRAGESSGSVYTITNTPSTSLTASLSTYTSEMDFGSQLASKFGLTFSVGMFSLNPSMNRARKNAFAKRTSTTYAMCSAEYIWYTATLNTASAAVTSALSDAVGALGSNPSQSAFNTFFQTYGTHYYESVTLGGRVVEHGYVSTSSLATSNSGSSGSSVNAGASAILGGFKVSAGFDTSSSNSNYQSTLNNIGYQSSSINAEGGNPALITDSSDPNAWADSIKANPVVVGGILKSIGSLAASQIAGSPSEQAFATALAAYLNSCPSTSLGLCSGHGTCNFASGTCSCANGFQSGPQNACELLSCPTAAASGVTCNGAPCNSDGTCDCAALYGWGGDACDVSCLTNFDNPTGSNGSPYGATCNADCNWHCGDGYTCYGTALALSNAQAFCSSQGQALNTRPPQGTAAWQTYSSSSISTIAQNGQCSCAPESCGGLWGIGSWSSNCYGYDFVVCALSGPACAFYNTPAI